MRIEDGAALSKRLGKFQRRRRIALALLTVAILFGMLFVRAIETGDEGFHEYVETFGITAILVAIFGRLWCTLYIGGRKNQEIVQSGPYSITRNPLYFFSTIGAIGIGAMVGSVTVAAFFGLCCYMAFSVVIAVEEYHLQQHFGEPYQIYVLEVPRFLPNPLLYRDLRIVSVRLDTLYRTFADGLVFLLAYPFFETVESLQEGGVLPVLLHLY